MGAIDEGAADVEALGQAIGLNYDGFLPIWDLGCVRPNSSIYRGKTRARRIDNETAEDNPATAHLFIVNPLHARSVDRLFSTHPDMGERIRRLRAMAGSRQKSILPQTERRTHKPWR